MESYQTRYFAFLYQILYQMTMYFRNLFKSCSGFEPSHHHTPPHPRLKMGATMFSLYGYQCCQDDVHVRPLVSKRNRQYLHTVGTQ